MVEVMTVLATDHLQPTGSPQVQVHHKYRDIFGDSIAVVVYGEMKIAAGQRVLAQELGLKTIQVLVLTPELAGNNGLGYMVQKYINHKGEYNNYASIDIYDDASNWITAGNGPVDGSIWLDFVALGE